MVHTESLEVIVGRRVRNLRESAGITLDQLASRAREHGLRWATARVVELEKGQLRLTLQILLAVAQSLAQLRDEQLSLADLLETDAEWIQLTPEWLVTPGRLAHALNGQPVALGNIVAVEDVTKDRVRVDERLVPTLAEERLARKLGVRPKQIAMWAHMLWGKHLDDEVRARIGEGTTPQARGHVTRELEVELRAQLERHGDG